MHNSESQAEQAPISSLNRIQDARDEMQAALKLSGALPESLQREIITKVFASYPPEVQSMLMDLNFRESISELTHLPERLQSELRVILATSLMKHPLKNT